MKTRLFAREHIAHIVQHVGLDNLMDETIGGIAQACADVRAGRFEVPARSGFAYDTPATGLLEWMPAMRVGEKIAIKLVGYHPDNPDRMAVPTILSSIVVFDPSTGHLAGVMDGTFLTALRTGAASALATRELRSDTAASVGLIGAGAQAVTQLHAIGRIMNIERVVAFDTDPSTAATLAGRMAAVGGSVGIHTGALEDAAACDVVCTATSVPVGAGPVLEDAMLKDDAHINAVGADFPGKTEVPLATLRRALVCPDFPEQATVEGECQQLEPDDIGPDLIDVVTSPRAEWREQLTVFDSTGWAVEDYVVAEIMARHGQSLGIGQTVELESLAGDPKDPYGFLKDVIGTAERRVAGG